MKSTQSLGRLWPWRTIRPWPSGPVAACRSACKKLNRALDAEGYPQLQHGIGIHTGQVLAANIGSPDRLSYLLMGDTVNLASRLKGLTREFGVEMIVSAATYEKLPGQYLNDIQLKKFEPVRVKGRQNPVEAYTLEAI